MNSFCFVLFRFVLQAIENGGSYFVLKVLGKDRGSRFVLQKSRKITVLGQFMTKIEDPC